MAGLPSEIEMRSIVCMIMMTEKYIFEAFLNCSSKLSGKNEKKLYFDVNTLLLINFYGDFKLIDLNFIGSSTDDPK